MEGMPPPPVSEMNLQLASALKQLSATKFGRPKSLVDEQINERLSSPELPPQTSTFNNPYSAIPPAYSSGSTLPPKPKSAPSFLDEWLAKRKGGQSTAMPPNTNFPKSNYGSANISTPTNRPMTSSNELQHGQELKIQRDNGSTNQPSDQ
jgi:hypothetical protein